MMNKMLSSSSTTIMAFHNNRFTSSSPSKSSYLPMRSTRTNAFNTINMINNNNNNNNGNKKSSFYNENVYSADLIGTDYFVSSLDFEYDLFLNGLVNCDNSGYRNYHRMRNQKDLQYNFSLIDATDTADNKSDYGGNNNYRDDISKSLLMPYQLMANKRQPITPGTTTITSNGKHNQHYNPDISSTTSTINTTVTDNISSILNSPTSKTPTAYRYLQRPNKHQAIPNDYTSLSFGANNNKANTSGSNQNSSQQQTVNQAPTSLTTAGNNNNNNNNNNNINNGKINNTGQQSNKIIVLSTNGSKITSGNCGSNQANGINNTNCTTITANSPNKTCTSLSNNQINKVGENCLQIPPPSSSPQPSSPSTTSLSSQPNCQSPTTISSSTVQQHPNNDLLSSQFEENIDISDNLSHQHLHALHRFRQQRKKGLISRLRDVVISYSPRARGSVLNRNDIYSRYGKEEKETLAAFDFLNEDQCNDDTNTREQELINTTTQSLNKNEKPNEPSFSEYYSEIDLELEEFDLTHPFSCDTINEDENENDENNAEDGAFSTKDNLDTNKIQMCKSNSNNDRFQSMEAVPDSSAVPPNRLTNNNNNNHSIRRFRFGFPRKSNSMEFQSSVKRLNELEDDESESFSGSHSVQETLVTGLNGSNEAKSSLITTEEVNKLPLNKGRRRYFLNTTSINHNHNNNNKNNNNNNEKKKNRNKNKSKNGKQSSMLTLAINSPATMTVTE